nr:uncharacterized protein LOC129050506 isoform X2 [Pongo abelii]
MSCLSGNEGTPVAPEIGGGCLHWPLRKHSVCRNEGSRSGREKSTAIPLLSGAVRPSAVSMANPCPVNCSSWGCPKSTRPAYAAVMRRSKAPCRSTCRSAAYTVSMRPARVWAQSRRCTQHTKCTESPERRLNHSHIPSSHRAGTWPWVS